MAFALVTPASRGIGLALTQHLLSTTPTALPVIATARRDIPGVRERILSKLDSESSAANADRLDVVPCDLESESSIADMAAHIQDKYMSREGAHLKLGFCIPGMLVPERALGKIDYDSALQTLKLNLLAPMLLAKHINQFLPNRGDPVALVRGLNPGPSILAFMSARVGSIADNGRGGWYSYRTSKAGVNQLVKSIDCHLKVRSVQKAMCVALHPGTVKTDLSKEFWETTPKDRLFTPEFAAERMCELVRRMRINARGKCWDWRGMEIPP